MMKLLKTSFWALPFAALFVITACDKVDRPFLEDTEGKCGIDLPSLPIRKILVEDFTGHTCGNCPRAAEAAESLKEIYCDHIVTIATHIGWFAKTKSNSDSSYAYDFTTQIGDELDTYFGVDGQGLPRGMVNRTEVDNKLILAYGSWGTGVEALVGLAADMDITIENEYEEATRTVTTKVTSGFINNLSGTFNVVVVITEDSIINWQKDYDPALPDDNLEFYVHRHALRGSFNGAWGDEVGTGDVGAGTSVEKTYSMVLPDEWVESRCSVVAYVYEKTSKEVIEAEEEHVK